MASGISTSATITSTVSNKYVLKDYILLIVLGLLQFSFLLDYIIMIPLGPHIITSLNIRPNGLSYLISGYTFSAAISVFLASFFIDKFERKRALLVCYLLFSLGPLLCFLSTGFYTLLLARIYTGAFAGLVSALIMTVLGDAVHSSKLGRATGFVLAANAIAQILGIPAAIYISDNWNWKTPYVFLFFLNLAIAMLIFLVIPEMRKHMEKSNNKNKRLLSIIKNPNFVWPLIFMSSLTFAGGATILPFLSTFMVANYSFRGDELSFLFFMGGLGSLAAGPIVGNLTDRFGKQNVFLWLNFLSIIPILGITMYPLGKVSIVIFVTTFFFMLSTGRHMSGMALVNSSLHKSIRGKFLSFSASIQLMAGTCGTLLMGMLLSTEDGQLINFDIVGIVAMCATIMCIFTAFLLND